MTALRNAPSGRGARRGGAAARGLGTALVIVMLGTPGPVRLMSFILSPEGQGILARHGFTAPTAPGG